MYHSRCKGTHYSAGFWYGKILKEHNMLLKDSHSIDLTKERKEYYQETLPIYQKEYPEILEEIKGVADGNGVSFDILAGFLISMYVYTAYNFCSCIVSKNTDGTILFGRNSDFLTAIEKYYESYYYKLDNGYSFVGNSTAFIQIEDGINEYGLAVGLTFVYSKEKVPGLNAGMLVRYLLEKCKSVEECLDALHTLTIGSAQTLTIADRSGAMVVVECNSHDIEVIKPKQDTKYVFTTNHFNSDKMKKYNPDIDDDMFSHQRYKIIQSALAKTKEYTLSYIQEILSGKHGFMCQYDRKLGGDTVWSSVYDISHSKIYRCEGNPSRKKYKEDTRLKFR